MPRGKRCRWADCSDDATFTLTIEGGMLRHESAACDRHLGAKLREFWRKGIARELKRGDATNLSLAVEPIYGITLRPPI